MRFPLCVVKCGGDFFNILHVFHSFALSFHYLCTIISFFDTIWAKNDVITTEKLNEE